MMAIDQVHSAFKQKLMIPKSVGKYTQIIEGERIFKKIKPGSRPWQRFHPLLEKMNLRPANVDKFCLKIKHGHTKLMYKYAMEIKKKITKKLGDWF